MQSDPSRSYGLVPAEIALIWQTTTPALPTLRLLDIVTGCGHYWHGKHGDDLMNAPHWHLILNHIPVLGTAFGLGLLAFALWRKSDELKKAAFGALVIVALLAMPAYLTGEPAEGMATGLPGVSKAFVEQHEEAATVAFIGVLVIGFCALAGLVFFRRGKTVPGWFGSLILAALLIVSGLMAWTANLGGQVRHTEIRGAPAASASGLQ